MAAAVQLLIASTPFHSAQQIRHRCYGETLEGLLSFISGKLSGIVNGIDTEVYNPVDDKYTSLKPSPSIRWSNANKLPCKKKLV